MSFGKENVAEGARAGEGGEFTGVVKKERGLGGSRFQAPLPELGCEPSAPGRVHMGTQLEPATVEFGEADDTTAVALFLGEE